MAKVTNTHAPEEAAAVWIDIEKLTPWVDNPRKNDEAAKKVMASIKRFGFGAPLLARKENGEIIAGHTRLKAAQSLGLKQVPVRYLDLDPAEAHLLALADNRLNEVAEWDQPKLMELLSNFSFDDVDLAGWDQKALEQMGTDLLKGMGDVTEDEAPEPPEVAVTKPGDLWILGQHRLLCGDSAVRADIDRVMQGDRACCVFTDPPYGVSQAKKNRELNKSAGGKGGDASRNETDIVDDDLSPEELKQRLVPAFVNLREAVMAEDCTLFVSAPQGGELGMMMMMMQEAGLRARHVLIWKKNCATFSMGRLDYDYAHEPILLTWGKRHKRPMLGKHKTSVWEVDKPRSSKEHPTMKPVELYANAYMNNSDQGDIVADIYGGSGTCIIAAEQVGRSARVIEISPHYCDVIVKRWETLTGKKAELSAQ